MVDRLRNPVLQATDDINNKNYSLPKLDTPARKEPSKPDLSSYTAPKPYQAPDVSKNLLPSESLAPAFMRASVKYGVPANVLMALAQQESSYNPKAIGVETQYGRANGIMQFLPSTAQSLKINPFDANQSIDAAAMQFRDRLDNGYTLEEAVMAHHGGDNREQWGPKTKAYYQDVYAKSGAIYKQATKGEQRAQDQAENKAPSLAATESNVNDKDSFNGSDVPLIDNAAISPSKEDIKEIKKEDSSTLKDMGRLLNIGVDRMALGFREGVRQIFGNDIVHAIDQVDKWASGKESEELLNWKIDHWNKDLSPEMFEARKKDWVSNGDDGYEFGPAWGDWRSYSSGLVESLPETAALMFPAGQLAKMTYFGKIAQGATTKVAAKAAATTATVAGGLIEGFMGGGSTAQEIKTRIMGMTEEELSGSDAVKSLMDDGKTFEESKSILAGDSSSQAFVLAGVLTGIFGGQGDRVISNILSGQVSSRLKASLKGAVAEGVLEEAPQSFFQAVAGNQAMQGADPSIPLTEGAANQTAGGLVAGSIMGGGLGAGATIPKSRAEIAGEMLNAAVDGSTFAESPDKAAVESLRPDWNAIDSQFPDARLDGELSRTTTSPDGPIGRAVSETAAEATVEAVKGESVTVVAEDGQTLKGSIADYQEDGNGAFEATINTESGESIDINQNSSEKVVFDSAIDDLKFSAIDDVVDYGDLDSDLDLAIESGDIAQIDEQGAVIEPEIDAAEAQAISSNEELSPRTQDMIDNPASGVIKNKETGEVVMETSEQSTVNKINTEKYEAVGIAEHLFSLNKKDQGDNFDAKSESIETKPVIKKQTVSTPRGDKVDVEYKVVEASDLTTSNIEGGAVNPEYPAELQPRDRSRAASLRQIDDIAQNLNPELLGESPTTTDGAPLISNQGVVESGNGRVQAINKAYNKNGESAAEYRSWLQSNGYSSEGIKNPVLVRVRTSELDDASLQDYVKSSNERTTLSMSTGEQSSIDREKLSGILDSYAGGDITSAGNRDFVRQYMSLVIGKGDVAGMVDEKGILSQDGRRRIQAGLMGIAYGDTDVVSEMFESTDTDMKSIGDSLMDVSGKWAQMRSADKNGDIASGSDATNNLMEAVNVVRKARSEGRTVQEILSQGDMFSGGVDPMTEGFVRIFYKGDNFRRPRSKQAVTEALNNYVDMAMKTNAGKDMFGDEIKPQQLMEATNGKISEIDQATTRSDAKDSEQSSEQRGRPQPETVREAETEAAKPEVKTGMPETLFFGPTSFKPSPIGGELYRETNMDGINSLLRETLSNTQEQGSLSPVFVTDDKNLALGQGGNRGVSIEFDGDLVSGAVNEKPGTGIEGVTGKEYKTDYINRNAIKSFTIPKGMALKGLGKVFSRDQFNVTENDGGSKTYTRKGLEQADKWKYLTEKYKKVKGSEIAQKDINGVTYNAYTAGEDKNMFAVDGNSNVIGSTFFGYLDGELKGSVEVKPDLRRKGIAKNMYDFAEEIEGVPITPSKDHSKDAAAFWADREKQTQNEPNKEIAEQVNEPVKSSNLIAAEKLFNGEKAWINKNLKDSGVKKSSPGYEGAKEKAELAYESEIDNSLAGLSFKEFQSLHPDVSESMAKNMHDSHKEAAGEGFDLTTQTEEELADQAEALNAAKEKEQAEQKVIDDKAKADAEVNDFNLSGSDSVSDIAESMGQDDIFSQENKPKIAENKIFTEDAANAARKLLKSKLGQMNSGLDPEIMQAGITLAGYHIEKGARSFSAYTKAMLNDLGEAVKPYLKSWYMAAKYDPRASDFDGMDSADIVDKTNVDEVLASVATEEKTNDQYTANNTKPDSAKDGQPEVKADNGAEGGSQGRSQAEEFSQEAGGSKRSSPSLDGSSANAFGESSNKPVHSQKFELEIGAAGNTDSERSIGNSTGGLFADKQPVKPVSEVVREAPSKNAKLKKSAFKSVNLGDQAQIKKQMPFLSDGQAEDIAFVENRLSKPDGYGALLTNGTGTGKTFIGLGSIKRQVESGKGNILIAVPKQTIADAWVKAGKRFFDLNINTLKSNKDAGEGVVITTYANMNENVALVTRDWDGFSIDEAHYLSSDEKGSSTLALQKLRMLSLKRNSAIGRIHALNPKDVTEMNDLYAKAAVNNESNNERNLALAKEQNKKADAINIKLLDLAKAEKDRIDAISPQDMPRSLFLSATPFAYDKNVMWANEFLFDWNSGADGIAYNSGGDYERFMMEHFGYRMRYNKLTRPDSKVDSSLMERSFNKWLRDQGVLSSRGLDSNYDYDRKFIITKNAIGTKVDEALFWLRDNSSGENKIKGVSELSRLINDKFDYHSRMYFLEALKARESIAKIKEHLALGRKVLVLHDFKKGGAVNPFIINSDSKEINSAYQEFKGLFPSLINDFDVLESPVDTLSKEFPEIQIYNGNVSAKNRVVMEGEFNSDDERSPRVMLAQGDAMREGVSIHDTTGKNPRVTIHLGMPGKPTAAIQQEGRTYRTGQSSDAMFRYLTIGTNWERYAFASKIAGRAGTAENLAIGDQARGLKESFISAYENAGDYPAGFEGEGIGGKAFDKSHTQSLTPWDSAKAYYYGTKKQGSGRGATGRESSEFFATPEPVGLKMVQWADVKTGEKVLEPSAGHGAIARWFPEDTTNRAIEKYDELASKLALRFNGDLLTGDFMGHNVVNKYDAIVMNPPFGLGGKEAVEHVSKAIKHISNGGRIVALIPSGPAADKQFNKLFLGEESPKNIVISATIELPNVTFERAGTKVSTKVLVIDRIDNTDLNVNSGTNINLSNIETVDQLFDEIQLTEVAPRPVIEPEVELPSAQAVEGGFESWESVHTKTNEDLFMVTAKDRVSKEDFSDMRSMAKSFGGYWSRFGKAGFIFKNSSDREGFIKAMSPEDKLSISDISEEEAALYLNSMNAGSNKAVETVTESLKSGEAGALIDELMDSGKLKILNKTPRSLIDRMSINAKNIGAVAYDNGQIAIIAPNIKDPSDSKALTNMLLHETFHATVPNVLGEKKWNAIQSRLESILDAQEKKINDGTFKADTPWRKGLLALSNANKNDPNMKGNRSLQVEEFGAYAIEHYDQAPAGIKEQIRNFIDMIKDFVFRKFGVQLGSLTPGQLRATAKAVLKSNVTADFANSSNLKASINSFVIPKTGVPIKVNYAKNTESSQKFSYPSMDFGRDIEISGDYLVIQDSPMGVGGKIDNWDYGTVEFKNPLVLEHKNTTSTGWKKDLSGMFGGKIKKSLANAVKKAGYDGVITYDNHGYNETVNISGVKSSGEKFSIQTEPLDIASEQSNNRFDLPKETKGEALQRVMQDRFNRVKKAMKIVTDSGGTISEAADVYKAEERFHGRSTAKIEDFMDKELEPFVKQLAKTGITLDEVAEYSYARHAAERNAYAASINDKFENGNGSGMTNNEADLIMSNLGEKFGDDIVDAHKALMDMTSRTRKYLKNEGLISAEESEAWGGMFENYVPLKGFEDVDEFGQEIKKAKGAIGSFKGFSVPGRESKAITGRQSKATQIIENIVAQREQAIIRAEKNRVAKSLLRLVLDNKDDSLWAVNEVTKKPIIVEGTKKKAITDIFEDRPANKPMLEGKKVKYVPVRDKYSDNVIVVKQKGREILITIKDPIMAEQLKMSTATSLPPGFAQLNIINRALAQLWTALNPVFTVTNYSRDVQTAVIHALGEETANKKDLAKKTLKYALPGGWAMRASISHERSKDNEGSQWYERYRQAGGKTGFYSFDTIEDKSKELSKMIKQANGDRNKAAIAAGFVFDAVMTANAVVENMPRLASFRAGVESGMSDAEAASFAKNLTVNFNRRGEWTHFFGSMYLFFNPAVQGVARMGQAIVKSKKVRAAAASITIGTAILAVVNREIGGDDEDGEPFYDKIPNFVKMRNIVIMDPRGYSNEDSEFYGYTNPEKRTGGYFKIPMPYGYSFFASVGNAAYDTAFSDKSKMEVAGDLAESFFMSFNPVGDGSPTVLAPWMQLEQNKNFFDAPIMPEQPPFGVPKPDSQRYFPSMKGTVLQESTEFLNSITGGNDARPGVIDISPESIEHIFRSYAGGLGSAANDMVKVMTQDDAELSILPFAKQVIGTQFKGRAVSKFYDNSRAADIAKAEADIIYEEGDKEKINAWKSEHGWEADMSKNADNVRKELSKLRKEQREVKASTTLSKSEKSAIIKKIQLDMEKEAVGFNREWNKRRKDSKN